jgi:hypothetical protein
VSWFRASLALALLLLLSLTSFGPAAAGGPTSALLSVPGEGRTASLYYTDPEYDALAGLVGIAGDTGTGEVDSSGGDHANGPGITVTWLIHDVSPWRVDRIYPQAKGAPWIATQVGQGESIWESPVVWHQPEHGTELMTLLDKLGLGDAARGADDFTGVAGAAVPPQPEPADGAGPASTDEPAAADPSGIAGIWWALAGLVAGVLVTLLGLRLRRSETPDSGEPHSPDLEPAPDRYSGGVADEVSWPAPRR